MKLSTRAIYGLRALIDLGLYGEDDTVSLQSIAGRENISVSYLEQLMPLLKKAGFVKAVRGAAGGYRLGKPADQISVGEILRVLEGSLEAVKCQGTSQEGSCQGNAEEKRCHGADLCVAKYVWKRINESIVNAVDTMWLKELVEESRKLHVQKQQPGTENDEYGGTDNE